MISTRTQPDSGMPLYRVDFHHHVQGDPVDVLGYSARQLVDDAVRKGLHAIAVTPHGRVFRDEELRSYAHEKGLLLIFGIEKRIEGREVLLLNVESSEIPIPMTFKDLHRLRKTRGNSILVVAPHPFYPSKSCMGERLDEFHELFDAVEYAHLHLPFYNPNDAAVVWARARGKAILSNSDTHGLFMLGHNFTEVEAEQLTVEALFESIRKKQVRPVVHIPSFFQVGRFLVQITFFQWILRSILPSKRREVALTKKGFI